MLESTKCFKVVNDSKLNMLHRIKCFEVLNLKKVLNITNF